MKMYAKIAVALVPLALSGCLESSRPEVKEKGCGTYSDGRPILPGDVYIPLESVDEIMKKMEKSNWEDMALLKSLLNQHFKICS
jgi:hypothetical protein